LIQSFIPFYLNYGLSSIHSSKAQIYCVGFLILLGGAAAIVLIFSILYGIGLLVYIIIPSVSPIYDPSKPTIYIFLTMVIGALSVFAIGFGCAILWWASLGVRALYEYSEGIVREHEKYAEVKNDDMELK
jgi:hypothetical protein